MSTNDDQDRDGKVLAIYHVMRPREDFEETAGMLWVMVRDAARQFPGKPRVLFMDIEGHTARGKDVPNQVDDYDADASEVVHFVRAGLGPFLTETPWGKTDESTPQRDPDVEAFIMTGPDDNTMVILTGDKDQPVRYDRRVREGEGAAE